MRRGIAFRGIIIARYIKYKSSTFYLKYSTTNKNLKALR